MILDTGAPLSVASTSSLGQPQAAFLRRSVDVMGLRFANATIAASETLEVGERACARQPPAGYLGANFLQHLSLHFDYRASTLHPLSANDPLPNTPNAATPITLPLQIKGGGSFTLADDTDLRRDVGATRLLVEIEIEGRPTHAMIDTGFSFHALRAELLSSLPQHSAPRPQACCQRIFLANGGLSAARLTRLSSLKLGEHSLTNQIVMLLGGPQLFNSLSAETGVEISMILGAPFFQQNIVRIDYPNRTLTFRPYTRLDHLTPDPYLSTGFQACEAADPKQGALIVGVFNESSAREQGVQEGELLVSIDDHDLREASAAQIQEILRDAPPNQPRIMRFETLDAEIVERSIERRQLLPDYLPE